MQHFYELSWEAGQPRVATLHELRYGPGQPRSATRKLIYVEAPPVIAHSNERSATRKSVPGCRARNLMPEVQNRFYCIYRGQIKNLEVSYGSNSCRIT